MFSTLFSFLKKIAVVVFKLVLTVISIIFMILAGLLDFVFSLIGLGGDLLHLIRDGYNSATSWITNKLTEASSSATVASVNQWCDAEVL